MYSPASAPLLDLLGHISACPQRLGDGQLERIVRYLFYVADRKKTDLPYISESGSSVEWYRLRREEATTPEAIVALAKASRDLYGFSDFKLKGGVFPGSEEMEAVRTLKRAFPDGRITIDPNGGWLLKEAVELCRGMHGILSYCEDGAGPRSFRGARSWRVPPRHGAAYRDGYDRHRLANGLGDASVRGYPAGRPSLLDDGGFGTGGTVLRGFRPRGALTRTTLRYFAGHVQPYRRRGSGQDNGRRHALDLAGGRNA